MSQLYYGLNPLSLGAGFKSMFYQMASLFDGALFYLGFTLLRFLQKLYLLLSINFPAVLKSLKGSCTNKERIFANMGQQVIMVAQYRLHFCQQSACVGIKLKFCKYQSFKVSKTLFFEVWNPHFRISRDCVWTTFWFVHLSINCSKCWENLYFLLKDFYRQLWKDNRLE